MCDGRLNWAKQRAQPAHRQQESNLAELFSAQPTRANWRQLFWSEETIFQRLLLPKFINYLHDPVLCRWPQLEAMCGTWYKTVSVVETVTVWAYYKWFTIEVTYALRGMMFTMAVSGNKADLKSAGLSRKLVEIFNSTLQGVRLCISS